MPATGRQSLKSSVCVAGVLGALAAGCGNPLPGTILGTYQVTATAGTNTCGGPRSAGRTYQFDVQFLHDRRDPPLEPGGF